MRNHKNIHHISAFFLAISLLMLCTSGSLNAQGQEVRWMRIGDLHNWYSSLGAEIEVGRTGDETQQQDGLRWPAQFQFQDNVAAKSLWIGTTNFDDPILGQVVPHKVNSVGTRDFDPVADIMPDEFKMVGRFRAPLVVVDGNAATDNRLNDIVDEIREDQIQDRMIVSTFHSGMGISCTRKIIGFSQQNHDDYFIYEYVFKNTGIIDNNGTTRPVPLTDVWFHFQHRYAIGHEAFRCECGWDPENNINWGRNTVNQVVGQDPNAADFEFRASYSWYGRHSQAPANDLGLPHFGQSKPLAAAKFIGVITLHADTGPGDQTDDLFQPRTTQYLGSDDQEIQRRDPFNTSVMTQKYNAMSAGHPNQTHAQQVGNGFADIWGTDPGGYSQGQGFGPYNLQPGDSIRIVMAEAVGGLSREKAWEVGRAFYRQEPPYTMPDGSTTTDRMEYKNAWVMTAEDSLFQAFRRAREVFNNNYEIPLPPPPPDQFEVASGGDKISLTWSSNAESWPNFDGYEVYRGFRKSDTTFTKIFECDRSNLVNAFNDTTARRGENYYYYVVSKDDGSTNDINPGVPLRSSKFFTITNTPAFLRRPASEGFTDIRIVPNPFHIQARDLQFGSGQSKDRIAFFGLPPVCTIRIFTERGDLIKTIEHNDGTGDELWDSLTESRQLIVSGLYIVHFQTPDGQSDFRKLIVIR